MKTPYYETSGGATAALLLSDAFVKCDLYTITCAFGVTLRYTTAPMNINVAGTIFHADQVLVDIASSSRGHWKTGTGADTWQVVMAPRSYDVGANQLNPDTIGGLPWIEAAKKGVFDGADVQVDRAVLAAWPTLPAQQAFPTGVFTLFHGIMGAVDVGRSQVSMTILSYMDLLTSNSPRNVFQSGCGYTLFDTGCAILASSWVTAGTVAASSTQSNILATISPPGSSTFVQGRIVMTSGQNNGFMRGVKSFTPGTPSSIVPTAPWFFPINPGETFNIYPGCDKTASVCGSVFSNNANFGGQQKIPSSTTAA